MNWILIIAITTTVHNGIGSSAVSQQTIPVANEALCRAAAEKARYDLDATGREVRVSCVRVL